MTDRQVTTAEAAKMLKVSVSRIAALMECRPVDQKKKLTGTLVNGKWMVDVSSIEERIAEIESGAIASTSLKSGVTADTPLVQPRQ